MNAARLFLLFYVFSAVCVQLVKTDDIDPRAGTVFLGLGVCAIVGHYFASYERCSSEWVQYKERGEHTRHSNVLSYI